MHTFDSHVEILRQTPLERSIHPNAVECARQARPEPIAQVSNAQGLRRGALTAQLGGFPKTDDRRNIERARSIASLVTATVDERSEIERAEWRCRAAHVQSANTLRSVDLVRTQRHEIDLERTRVERQQPRRLHRVAMHERPPRVRDASHFAERMEHADLVVAGHHADEQRVVRYRLGQLLQVQTAGRVDAERRNAESLPLHGPARIEHGAMFGGNRHDVPTSGGRARGEPLDGEVVRLRRAAREDQIPEADVDERRNLLARAFDGLVGLPAIRVIPAGRVAEMLREIRQHDVEHPSIDRGGRVRVEIDQLWVWRT